MDHLALPDSPLMEAPSDSDGWNMGEQNPPVDYLTPSLMETSVNDDCYKVERILQFSINQHVCSFEHCATSGCLLCLTVSLRVMGHGKSSGKGMMRQLGRQKEICCMGKLLHFITDGNKTVLTP